ncbi:glycosyltransferase family 4 protein [Fictibacillus nanhaiensis]|uniref:glycosyltransferase family 4 protein n=1 Tax=Fictibacillus nanhaiensis TaxID=742169 RepID=UPI003C13F9EF
MKQKVLVLAEYYIPGIKGGGPIQSIKNLVNNLTDIDFNIITADRDMGDESAYKNIKEDVWTKVQKSNVYYTNINKLNFIKLAKIINEQECDSVYLNSFFSYKLSILVVLLSKFKIIKPKQLILAPRGEFSPGAFAIKQTKKKLFIYLAKTLRLYRNVTWHATAKNEKKDIEDVFGASTKIVVASNLTEDYTSLSYDKNIEKKIGELKIVFISRVHPKKNLKMAIELLKSLKGNVEFNIYGPIEDKEYWGECVKLIRDMPRDKVVNYKGIIEHTMIMEIFKSHHIFLFPTFGENFGHVISEALIGGCPIIVSDQTPWKDLKRLKVGADLSLENHIEFKSILQEFINLNKYEYDSLSKNAFDYGKHTSNKKHEIDKTYNLFFKK